MNIFRKIGKTILALVLLLSAVISNFLGISTKVEAATFFVNEANLKSKGTTASGITYNGIGLETTYVYYVKDGAEYPAYCISPGADGVGEYGSYNVSVESLLTDTNIWRVITNGYPYKTVSELGCQNAEEAFAATKQAVYCAIFGREASWYGTINEKGVRVRNAMAQILSAARSGSSGKPSGNIEIKEVSSDWTIETSLPKCLTKKFKIEASTSYNTFTVSLEGNFPEDATILDVNNNPKTTFSSGEQFKIALPFASLNKSGSFSVKVIAKLNTKPILYGRAPTGTGLQNYALTASVYEDAEGSLSLNYFKNNTEVQILKQDNKTLKPLSGVEFRILNSEKKPVYTNLVTDTKGKVSVTGLTPGKYYLEEVKGLDGYVKYDEQIAFDISYNQVLTITVNNTLEKKTESTKNTQTINVTQSKEETVIKDSKQTINKTKDEMVSDTEKVTKTANENTSNIQKLSNTSTENKNENYNTLVETLRTIIDNDNVNINDTTLNQLLDIDNSNTNINNNLQNLLASILNKNNNINNNMQNENANISNENNNMSKNVKNQNMNVVNKITDISNSTQNGNINISNQNSNINTNMQNVQESIEVVNSNTNSNIAAYNGVVRLPKTGM